MKSTNRKAKVQLPIGKQIKALFIGEKKEIRLLGIIILVGLVGIIAVAFSSSKILYQKDKQADQVVSPVDCEFRAKLNGVCVTSAADKTPALVAIMIENHPAARPQAGLAEADVVYEAMVEGNYTRFMAIFPYNREVVKVGPVRSSRPNYLDWLAEYDNPLYMHVGGSPDALQLIAQRDVWDANEMTMGSTFWRAGNRLAPHNTYTNTERWQKVIGSEIENKFVGWDFATSTPICATNCVAAIEIPYLRPDFVTGWKFKPDLLQYERWQGDGPHETETGKIFADTIAIMEVSSKVLDDVGRLEMKTVGSGPAIVIMNGQKFDGHWSKSGVYEPTNFYDQNDHEILFKPGKIWVEVVPKLSNVKLQRYD